MRKKLCAEPPLQPNIRTTSIDYDARREPKTSRFCCKCQKDIRGKARRVYLIEDMLAVHPADLESRNPRRNDLGWLLLGMDCAKAIGLEWSVDEVPDATTPEAGTMSDGPNRDAIRAEAFEQAAALVDRTAVEVEKEAAEKVDGIAHDAMLIASDILELTAGKIRALAATPEGEAR